MAPASLPAVRRHPAGICIGVNSSKDVRALLSEPPAVAGGLSLLQQFGLISLAPRFSEVGTLTDKPPTVSNGFFEKPLKRLVAFVGSLCHLAEARC
jgi:hypothetical protein